MKKALSIILALTFMIGIASVSSVSASDVTTPTVAEQIVMQSLGLSSLDEDFDYELVPVQSSTSGIVPYSLSQDESTAMAIVYTDNDDDGMISANTVYPFAETPDGDLVNAFEYATASGLNLNAQYVCNEITDLTLTLTTYYGLWTNLEEYIAVEYYKVYHSSAVWEKTNSSTSAYVTEFDLGVEARADKYSTSFVNLNTVYADTNYRQISNPVEGRTYSCAPLMSSTTSFLLHPSNGMPGENHQAFGCLVFTYYNRNGALRTDEIYATCFSYGP